MEQCLYPGWNIGYIRSTPLLENAAVPIPQIVSVGYNKIFPFLISLTQSVLISLTIVMQITLAGL